MGNRHTQFESVAGFGCSFGIATAEDRSGKTIELGCRSSNRTCVCARKCCTEHNSMDGRRVDERETGEVLRMFGEVDRK
jgi:hypothetical protein